MAGGGGNTELTLLPQTLLGPLPSWQAAISRKMARGGEGSAQARKEGRFQHWIPLSPPGLVLSGTIRNPDGNLTRGHSQL